MILKACRILIIRLIIGRYVNIRVIDLIRLVLTLVIFLDDIEVRAVVFKDDGDFSSVIQFDLLSINYYLYNFVFEAIKERKLKGFSSKNVLICATHSHTCPDPFNDKNSMDYCRFIAGKAAEALEDALKNYYGEDSEEWQELDLLSEEHSHDHAGEKIICTCFNVTENQIWEAIKVNGLTTVEEVTNYTKAGGACGRCKGIIKDIIENVIYDGLYSVQNDILNRRGERK